MSVFVHTRPFLLGFPFFPYVGHIAENFSPERCLLKIRVRVTVLIAVVVALHHLRSHKVKNLLTVLFALDPSQIDRVGEEIFELDLLIIPCNLLERGAWLPGDLGGSLHPPREIFLHGSRALLPLDGILHIVFQAAKTTHNIHLNTTHTPTAAPIPRIAHMSMFMSIPNPPRFLNM